MLKATRCRKAYGFTLIELTVVLVIIEILGTLIVTRIAGSTDDARIMKARHDVRQIFNGAEVFYARIERYPETYKELLTGHDDNGSLVGGVRAESDPWKNP